jgi:hypothetical protein
VQCASLFLAAEDPVAQAIRPRVDANGGDVSQIFILEETEFDPARTIARLKRAVQTNPTLRFIVLDPMNAFVKSGVDYFRDVEIRKALLRPLSDFAESTGTAVLGVVHLSKQEDRKALSRISGSTAYGAAARSVLGVAINPEDEGQRLIASVKSNYARKPGTIGFRIDERLGLHFETVTEQIDAEELFQRRDQKAVREGSFGVDWLRDSLRGGPVGWDELQKAAKDAGLNQSALYRARRRLGVISKTVGFGQFKSTTLEMPT